MPSTPSRALFFLAFLPQFAEPVAGTSVALQIILLGLAFITLHLVYLAAVAALFSRAMGDLIRNKPRIADVLRWLMGSILIALGLRLAIPERR